MPPIHAWHLPTDLSFQHTPRLLWLSSPRTPSLLTFDTAGGQVVSVLVAFALSSVQQRMLEADSDDDEVRRKSKPQNQIWRRESNMDSEVLTRLSYL